MVVLPTYLTAAELSERIHLSRDRIYKLVRGGKIPFRRTGGDESRVLFHPDEIEAWLKANAADKGHLSDPTEGST